jgi:hypothetical protein
MDRKFTPADGLAANHSIQERSERIFTEDADCERGVGRSRRWPFDKLREVEQEGRFDFVLLWLPIRGSRAREDEDGDK